LQTKSSEIIDDENVFVSQVQRVDLNDGIGLQDELEKKNIEIDDLNIKLKALQDQLNEKIREIVELKNGLKEDELKTNAEELITGPGEPILPQEGPLVFLNHSKIPDMRYFPIGNIPFSAVFENIPSEGPDWMLIHRRFGGSVDFGEITKVGPFGDFNGEFFLNMDILFKVISTCRHELYIELVDFDNVKAFAKYDHFEIGPKENYYNLKSLGAYSGNAGDALRLHLNCDYRSEKKLENGVSKKYYWWGSTTSM
uniref:Angiopoietin-related protein 1-like n=1 Tax=Drosophila rhopaloa TaxID=1041015 RepID=A0A6P4EKJ3_DRORH